MLLVERSDHLSTFDEALDTCRKGAGGTLILTGPSAGGKTALLKEFLVRAVDNGFLPLSGSGSRAERTLPLAVLNQLCHDAPLSRADLRQTSLIRDMQATAILARPARSDDRRTDLFMYALFTNVLELSRRSPVLIALDDLHHVDPLSLQCLLYVVRRIRSARILVVAAGRENAEPSDATGVYLELLDHATLGRLRVAPLSKPGTGELLAGELGRIPGSTLTTAVHAATGGSPGLVSAIAADLRDGVPAADFDPDGTLRAGPAFQRAVTRCLDRFDPGDQRLLQAMALTADALLSGAESVVVTARLAGVDPAVAQRRIADLQAGGLLRHPAARRAVLETLPAEDLSDLHFSAARILHEEAADPRVIALQLLSAGRSVEGWAIPILRAVADRALDGGDADRAIRMLRLAHSSSDDSKDQATIKAHLLHAQWRTGPATAVHRFPALSKAIRERLLPPPTSLLTVGYFLWFGRAEEARRTMNLVTVEDLDNDALASTRLTRVWTSHLYPGMLERAEADLGGSGSTAGRVTALPDLLADVLEAVLSKGSSNQALTTAEQTLQRTRLDDATLVPISAALQILIYTDHLEIATLWCERLITQATDRHAPTWRAIFGALRAEIALRQGRPADAEQFARSALSCISTESWGVAIGAPVATLLRALTLLDRLGEAGRLLEEPLPEAVFKTIWGLSFLRARGHYYQATSRPDAALEDFLTCGGLMEDWNLDVPGVIPWRLDASGAHLQLGQLDAAKTHIDAQLTQPGASAARTRGRSLRLLAATGHLQHRTSLLRDAVEMLHASGDQLELGYALADLSGAYHALGDSHRARLTVRRAWRLARECRFDALARVLPDLREAARTDDPDQATAFDALSDAERRVAALAAQGRTNRQIASRLFVTESTVEQHLTRVYRKLQVKRRADLPSSLPADFSNIA